MTLTTAEIRALQGSLKACRQVCRMPHMCLRPPVPVTVSPMLIPSFSMCWQAC